MLRMVSYPHRLKSGLITCYLNRTYHVLTTARNCLLDKYPSRRKNASCSAWASNADFSQKIRNQCAQNLRLSHSSRIDFCPSALTALSPHVCKFYEKGEWKHVPQKSTSPVNTGCA